MEETLFYSIEKSIKTYRKFAQRELHKAGFNVTVDQCLILQTIARYENITREQIAEKVFKDAASVTRIIELLIGKQYVSKEPHPSDSRRFNWLVSSSGKELLQKVEVVVLQNRKQALEGLSDHRINLLKKSLEAITNNCNVSLEEHSEITTL